MHLDRLIECLQQIRAISDGQTPIKVWPYSGEMQPVQVGDVSLRTYMYGKWNPEKLSFDTHACEAYVLIEQ